MGDRIAWVLWRKLLDRVLLVREHGGPKMGIAANQQEDVLPQKSIGKDLRTFPRNAGMRCKCRRRKLKKEAAFFAGLFAFYAGCGCTQSSLRFMRSR